MYSDMTDPDDVDPSYAPVVRAGELAFVSGQSPVEQGSDDPVGDDIAAQTSRTVANIEAVLATTGASLADVVKVNVYLADMADFERFDAEYRRHFAHPRPARTTVEARPDIGLIEIDVAARVSG